MGNDRALFYLPSSLVLYDANQRDSAVIKNAVPSVQADSKLCVSFHQMEDVVS